MHSKKSWVLKNRFLVAAFAPVDGGLVHLSADGRGAGMVNSVVFRYLDLGAACWHGTEGRDLQKRIEVVSVDLTLRTVTSVLRSEHLDISVCYRLTRSEPVAGRHGECQRSWQDGQVGTLRAAGDTVFAGVR